MKYIWTCLFKDYLGLLCSQLCSCGNVLRSKWISDPPEIVVSCCYRSPTFQLLRSILQKTKDWSVQIGQNAILGFSFSRILEWQKRSDAYGGMQGYDLLLSRSEMLDENIFSTARWPQTGRKVHESCTFRACWGFQNLPVSSCQHLLVPSILAK